jgi:hypothetical protein
VSIVDRPHRANAVRAVDDTDADARAGSNVQDVEEMAGARAGERGIATLADLAGFEKNEIQIALVPAAFFFSAVARLLSASSSVLRDVAMFMRM